ncbi:MAG: cupin domain-containing protein, partial [Proteobacteria bacterium]|nr:cupin domain-containing protein [Pseudomonadota bacterium]
IGSLGDLFSNPDRVEEIYEGLTSVSVDYGIMEHSDKVAMIPANVGWSDVGSWAALREINEKDLNGNVVKGNVLAVDSRNSLLYGQDRLVAALGLEGLVVVDTPDAVLVCREDMSQDVRKIVKQLINEGRDEALVHREVLKPWGAYKMLDRGEAYQLGWLDVLPGEQLSLKNHIHRAAHWIVVAGTATVTVKDRIVDVFCGEHIQFPEGSLQRVENQGSEKLRMIEIQTMSVVS